MGKPEQLRQRAALMRSLAAAVPGAEIRAKLLHAALLWDAAAQAAEEREAESAAVAGQQRPERGVGNFYTV